VIDAGAEEGQTHRNVDTGVEAHQLYWYVPLVVVLHDHDVERARPGPHHHGVGRVRTRRIDAFLHGGGHGRRYPLRIFCAEEPVLPGVRVQAGDGDSRFLDAELSQRLVGEADNRQLALRFDALYSFA
jgi:hypothetical protein